MDRLFARLGETETLESESDGQVDVITLLRLALKSELEASGLAGHWLPTTPEESHHHHLGREILEKYATTPELQELIAAAVRNTLAIADELSTLAAKTTGLLNIPVS